MCEHILKQLYTLHPNLLINIYIKHSAAQLPIAVMEVYSVGFDKSCKSWTIVVCTLLSFHYRVLLTLYSPVSHAYKPKNAIVFTCMTNGHFNSNTGI